MSSDDDMALRDTSYPDKSPTSILDRVFRRLVTQKLSALSDGEVCLSDGAEVRNFGSSGADGLRARVNIHDPQTYRALALGGTIGAAEAYSNGWWGSDDLTSLIRIMARNRKTAKQLEGWLTWAKWLVHLTRFRTYGNRKSQSRRNISAHYDLGNDFFEAFLDPTKTYSCAVFPTSDSSLEEGSRHKVDLICRKLELSSHDEILEIGSGWGSLAIYAARTYGCRVVTTTISSEQFAYVADMVRAEGLEGKVTILSCDYRDLPSTLLRRFDKVVSIEMIEAVGYAYLDRYFEVCNAMLKPGGIMFLQSIVITDAIYEEYRRSVDMIQRYIFPGGFLPSLNDLQSRIVRRTDLHVAELVDISEHYPRTLRFWRQRFVEKWSHLRALGYPNEVLRMWDYYFCYCEGGFLEQTVGDVQLLLAKPQS